MRKFVVTNRVPIAECVNAGYPNPETHPIAWLTAVRAAVALEIECAALDLDEATAIIRVAFERMRYVTPWLLRFAA